VEKNKKQKSKPVQLEVELPELDPSELELWMDFLVELLVFERTRESEEEGES